MLPLRQKIFIALTLASGLVLVICASFNLIIQETLNMLILFYSLGVPLCLLMLNTVLDLNDGRIFGVWSIIAIVFFLISLTTYFNERFIIQRNAQFKNHDGINGLLANYSTSSLKALLLFLIAYWFLNKLLHKKGLYLINTFKQAKWYHEIAQRKITGEDVFTNLVLFVVIIAAVLFGH